MSAKNQGIGTKKTIDLSFSLINLDGSEATENNLPVKASKIVANIIGARTTGDAMRQLDLALSIYKEEKIDCMESDVTLIKEIINESQLSSLAKGQILRALK